jgi:hypothetical protein
MSRATRERQARYNRIIAAPLAVFGLLAIAVAVAVVLAQPDAPQQPIKLGPLPTPTTSSANHPECPDFYAQHPDWDEQHGDAPCGTPRYQPPTSLPYSPNGCPADGHPWCSNPTATENPEGPTTPDRCWACPDVPVVPGSPAAQCKGDICGMGPTTTPPNLRWNVYCCAHPEWERCSIPPISVTPTRTVLPDTADPCLCDDGPAWCPTQGSVPGVPMVPPGRHAADHLTTVPADPNGVVWSRLRTGGTGLDDTDAAHLGARSASAL